MSKAGEYLHQYIDWVGSAVTTPEATKTVLNALFPSEFELYLISLELTSWNDEILDFFTFPINPSSFTKTEPYIKSIDRAYGTIVVNKTGKFAPQEINIKGNFGKEFKILIRESPTSFKALWKKGPKADIDKLSSTVKNGYGCFKVLQNICRESDVIDDGKPRKLYLHNFMLGESYLVEVLDFSPEMSLANNMIWNYSLKLKVLTPINTTLKNRAELLLAGQSQKLLTNTLKGIKGLL